MRKDKIFKFDEKSISIIFKFLTRSSTIGIGIVIYCIFLVLLNPRWLPLPQILSAQDLGMFLDVAWRFYQGQMPHADYSSAFGPFYALIVGSPLTIFGPYYDSYLYFPAIINGLFSILTFYFLRNHFNKAILLVYSISVGCVAGGINVLGEQLDFLGFIGFYNRIGYAMLLILYPYLYSPNYSNDKTDNSTSNIQYISIGIIAGLTMFIKINYFLITIGLIAVSITIFIEKKKRLAALKYIIISFIIFLIIGIVLFRFSITGYLRDVALTYFSRSQTHFEATTWRPLEFLQNTLPQILCILPYFILLLSINSIRGIIAVLVIFGSTFLIVLSQSSGRGALIPGYISAFFIAPLWIRSGNTTAIKQLVSSSVGKTLLWAPAIIAAIVFIISPHFESLKHWRELEKQISNKNPKIHRDSYNRLNSLIVSPKNLWGNKFMELVNLANETARKYSLSDKKIHYLDFTNIINFSGGYPSSKYTLLSVDRFVNLSKKFHISADEFFKDIDILIIPKIPLSKPDVDLWLEIYGDTLYSRFSLIEENSAFYLYEKKPE